MNAQESRQVVENYWDAMATNDFDRAGAWLHDDIVLDWPQSGERVRGRANFIAINANYPSAGRWRFTVRRLIADDGGVASEVEVSDGSMAATAITFSELRQGKILRQVEYWPDPFPPAAWRAIWVERIA
jgi:ketosteroid isomerase-like protein